MPRSPAHPGPLLLVPLVMLCSPPRGFAQTAMEYVPAPPDNPLKGLVPYARPGPERFPHSMEFFYLPLGELMEGPDRFDWRPLERQLDDIASRRHQAVFRVWMEYPGRTGGIPRFLEDQGLKVTEWLDTNTAPLPPGRVRTPDYSNPRLRAALGSFIAALGARYDGDPRIAYITAGLLGTWGEWHTHPRPELMADRRVQSEVMDHYENAFRRTPVLLRYPAGDGDRTRAPNHRRGLGYHDDSFAWATLDTGKPQDDWFFLAAMKAAGPGALEKWKTRPIGGEIRPELWGLVFDDHPAHPRAQDFAECVHRTHVTWLMDSGMFRPGQAASRVRNAIAQVRRMGYEFHVMTVKATPTRAGDLQVQLRVRNTGVAPFYHDWKVEFATADAAGSLHRVPVDWTLAGLLPGDPPRAWTVRVGSGTPAAQPAGFAVRVANPMPDGLPLRFANRYRPGLPDGWLALPGSAAPDGGTRPAGPRRR